MFYKYFCIRNLQIICNAEQDFDKCNHYCNMDAVERETLFVTVANDDSSLGYTTHMLVTASNQSCLLSFAK